jgi:hypothetical protein
MGVRGSSWSLRPMSERVITKKGKDVLMVVSFFSSKHHVLAAGKPEPARFDALSEYMP